MLIRKLAAAVGELGWSNGLLYLFGRALQRITGGRARLIRYLFVVQPVPAAPDARYRPSATTLIRLVGPTDLLVQRFPRPAQVIARRFQQGAICFAACAGEHFCGFLWLARDQYEEDEVRCHYELGEPECSAWDFDVHVEPQYRTGRTFARLWEAANGYLAVRSVRWSFSRISAFNRVSLASHARLGIRKLHTATFLCIGPVQFSWLGAAPFLHLSVSERSRPILRFYPPERCNDRLPISNQS